MCVLTLNIKMHVVRFLSMFVYVYIRGFAISEMANLNERVFKRMFRMT